MAGTDRIIRIVRAGRGVVGADSEPIAYARGPDDGGPFPCIRALSGLKFDIPELASAA